uniref:Uncharacterized protein n=1 Tax=Cacopsylla melanoneura TaxID=428564 RepID=A0A8D9F3E3_9HEMI
MGLEPPTSGLRIQYFTICQVKYLASRVDRTSKHRRIATAGTNVKGHSNRKRPRHHIAYKHNIQQKKTKPSVFRTFRTNTTYGWLLDRFRSEVHDVMLQEKTTT